MNTTTAQLRRDIAPGCKAMAQRAVDAERNFVATLQELASISQEDAQTVFDAYLRLGLVKRQLAIGRYTVTHGAFLDKANILRALHNLKSA